MTAVLLPFSFVLAQSYIHLAILIGSLLFVLLVELLNTALEAIANHITLMEQPLIGKAKDAGSAAVFLAIFIATLVWMGALFDWFASQGLVQQLSK